MVTILGAHHLVMMLIYGIRLILDEVIIDRLWNRYERLGERCHVYTAWNIPFRDSLTEELYSLGVRFNKDLAFY